MEQQKECTRFFSTSPILKWHWPLTCLSWQDNKVTAQATEKKEWIQQIIPNYYLKCILNYPFFFFLPALQGLDLCFLCIWQAVLKVL